MWSCEKTKGVSTMKLVDSAHQITWHRICCCFCHSATGWSVELFDYHDAICPNNQSVSTNFIRKNIFLIGVTNRFHSIVNVSVAFSYTYHLMSPFVLHKLSISFIDADYNLYATYCAANFAIDSYSNSPGNGTVPFKWSGRYFSSLSFWMHRSVPGLLFNCRMCL